MNKAQLHRAPFPRAQDLLKSLRAQIVARSDFRAAPSTNEVKLNQFSLHVRTRVFRKSRDLRRETHLVLPDCRAQFVHAHLEQLLVRNRRIRRNARGRTNSRQDDGMKRRAVQDDLHILHIRADSAKCARSGHGVLFGVRRIAAFVLGWITESVADPWVGQNVLGLRRIILDFLAKHADIRPQVFEFISVFRAPNGAQ